MELDSTLPSARSALNALGHVIESAVFLARGATSTTWKLGTSGGSYVFRKIDDDRVLDGIVDGFIRGQANQNGARVALPVTNSEEADLRIDGSRWSLDRFVSGIHPKRRSIPPEAASQLGETLAVVHDLPIVGFGRPEKLSNGVIFGQKNDPIQGVMHRFENPLPETWARGFKHPILGAFPRLRDQINSHLQDVSRRVKVGNGVVCHADLHERQLICGAGRLEALVDFGEAAILDRHWDLGSVLYFHGWRNFETIFAGYCSRSCGIDVCAELASSFSIAIAMHHASRSRLPGKGHRFGYAARHIQAVIAKPT